MNKVRADLSVCIPLHDPNGTNRDYLREAVLSISAQSVLPQQVVFTSSEPVSYINEISDLIPSEVQVEIRVQKTCGASENFNNAVRLSTARYVKLLCQDDFLVNTRILEESINKLEASNRFWLATGCVHFDDKTKNFTREIIPKYRNRILRGINTIGSPSVIMFRRENFLPFSHEMDFMYDCEWYVRMKHSFGKPILLKSMGTGIRLHSRQSTHQVSDRLAIEVLLASQFHSVNKWITKGDCSCIQKVDALA